ncbi:MAG: hypothetical protein ABSC50_01825 [Candidatus Bathyarchaeia archaeon]
MRRLRGRRGAVSSMISGIIVLGLFLVVLVAMVAVSQQYDTYQSAVNTMSQKDIDRTSENLKAVYPGLKGGFSVTGCGGKCNQYNMSLANFGPIGVQIVRIYINSTQQSSGCTSTNNNVKGPCTLGAQGSVTSFGFNSFDSYIIAGETNHVIRLWLPSTIVLPNASLVPSNGIWVVTSRGRVFSFEWPFPPVGQGLPGTGSPPTIFTGDMKIAYAGTGGAPNSKTDSKHTEQRLNLTINGGTVLYFVNPWITDGQGTGCSNVLNDVSGTSPNGVYLSVYSVNSLNAPLILSWGNMIILAADSSSNSKVFFFGGPYYGIVRNQSGVQQFTLAGTPVTISPGQDYYLIYQITQVNFSGGLTDPGDSFSGTAAMNNGYNAQAEDATFRELEVFLNGLYVRTTC